MSLRSIAQGINEAYQVYKADKRRFEEAMNVATDASQGNKKTILRTNQVVKVDEEKVVVVDDGATRRVLPF